MECLTDGDPLPKTRWTRVEENGREMVLDLPRFKVVSGKGNSYLIKLPMNEDYLYHPQSKVAIDGILFQIGLQIRHAHPSQAGVYKCTASSAVGTAVAQATLTVNEAPMMTMRPPAEVVVAVGESTHLDCFVVR